VKLKNNIEVSYNRLIESYEFDFSKAKKIGKVMSRMFPILLGKNIFNGIGYGVLDRVGFLEKEDIPPYYTVRGAVGEYLVNLFIIETYKKKSVDIVTKCFTPAMVNYDMFPKNDKFGGIVDIGISSPTDYRAVVEVKSKSLKDYDKIAVKKEPNEEEVLQGKQLAFLSSVPKLLMAFIFFNENQESNLKALVPTIKDVYNFDVKTLVEGLRWSAKDFQIAILPYKIDREQIANEMEKSYETLHRIVKLGSISKMHFNADERQYLNDLANYEERKPIATSDDLPF